MGDITTGMKKVVQDTPIAGHPTHCRVGYDHGPQVSDPRAPEWLPYMEGHERWWDRIWQAQKDRGMEYTTMISRVACKIGVSPEIFSPPS